MIRFGTRLINKHTTKCFDVHFLKTVNFILKKKSDKSTLDCCSHILPFSVASSSILQENVSGSDTLKSQATTVSKKMQDYGFQQDEINLLLEKQPELLKLSLDNWGSVISLFIEHQFEKEHILSILEKWPKVLTMTKSQLDKNLMAWTECGIGRDLVLSVLTTHPHFLKVDHNYLLKRIKQYQLHFESKSKVGKLLLLAPNTLEENWIVLRNKLNFLDELCTERSDLINSGVLSYSLFHIKVRHEFLIRTGIFKKPLKDFNKRLNKNPKLEDIVNTTDEKFVFKVAGLSMFEYSVFLDMYEREFNNDDDDEDDHNNSGQYSDPESDPESDETHKHNYRKWSYYKK